MGLAGRVDVWINNAGADVLTGEAAEWSFEEKLDRLWRVNVVATMRLSRLAGARMKQHASRPGQAVILNMGWDQAEHGMGGDSGEMFGAVKGGVMAFTRSLACSLAPEVRVNCLAPGWIKTAWGEHASEYWQERARANRCCSGWGTPDDVAQVARFLALPAAEFITGQVIPVNGGLRRGEPADLDGRPHVFSPRGTECHSAGGMANRPTRDPPVAIGVVRSFFGRKTGKEIFQRMPASRSRSVTRMQTRALPRKSADHLFTSTNTVAPRTRPSRTGMSRGGTRSGFRWSARRGGCRPRRR